MNTTTLRGVFPKPQPVYKRNFVRENIKQLKEMHGFIQESKVSSQSQEIKSDKFKHITPKVFSNIMTRRKLSHDSVQKRPESYNQIPKSYKPRKQKISDKGVQTERPEDIHKLYERGVLKYPSPSVTSPTKQTIHKSSEQGDASQNLAKNMQKLDLEEKQNFIKQNIKSIKSNKQKLEEPIDPLVPPVNYQKGTVPKYLKSIKQNVPQETPKHTDLDEGVSGLVLLPDEERKEYLRVARENYAALIKELNSMPMSNDTLKKRKRKMEIEDELKRLDEVVKIFQKPKVFVKADA